DYAKLAFFSPRRNIYRAVIACVYMFYIFVIKPKFLEILRLKYLSFLVGRVILILLVNRLRARILAYRYKFVIREISRPQYRRTFEHFRLVILIELARPVRRILFILPPNTAPLVP